MTIWNQKHTPENPEDIAGQNKNVREILSWLDSFRPGKGLMLTGPTGTGKTTLVETIARKRNLMLFTLNASDKRTKKEIESFLSSTQVQPLFGKGKIILIDELDGISGRSDRGGVSAIKKLVKTSRFPVFLLAQDPWDRKLKPLRSVSKTVKFSKTPVRSVAKRLREICELEDISHQDGVLKSLASWSQGDMRSAIQDLQTVAQGKQELAQKDLEILGHRGREMKIHSILPTIFKSKNIQASRKAIWNCDLDADDVLWWVESNIHKVYSGQDLASALDTLSKADLFRSRVRKQQNWRFKGFMVDLLASISLRIKNRKHGYIPWKYPDRFARLGRTRSVRAARKTLCEKIGSLTHTSTRAVKREYLPYLKLILQGGNTIEGIELEEKEQNLLN